jgi:hypothetical protein
MKNKKENEFNNAVGGAAMMPIEQTSSGSVTVQELIVGHGNASMEETYSMPALDPEDGYEDEDYDDNEEVDLESEAAFETGEDKIDEEGPADDDGSNGSGTDWSTEDIVRAINDIARRTVETGKLEIGQFVFEKVFKGDIKEVLSKNPYKSASLRAICDDEDLMVDHRKLGSWVKAAAFKADLELKGMDVSKFYLSHFLAILRVGNAEKRLELAKKAATEKLSGRDIVVVIEAAKQKSDPPTKGALLLKKVDDPFSLFADEEYKEFLSNKARLETELDSEDRLRMIKAIGARLGRMTEVNEFLETSKKNLVAIEMENLNGGSQ